MSGDCFRFSGESLILISERQSRGRRGKWVSVDEETVHLPAPLCLWLVLTHSTFNPNSPMLDSLGSPPRAQLNLASSPQTAVVHTPSGVYPCTVWTSGVFSHWLTGWILIWFVFFQGHLHVIWNLNVNGFRGFGERGRTDCIENDCDFEEQQRKKILEDTLTRNPALVLDCDLSSDPWARLKLSCFRFEAFKIINTSHISSFVVSIRCSIVTATPCLTVAHSP